MVPMGRSQGVRPSSYPAAQCALERLFRRVCPPTRIIGDAADSSGAVLNPADFDQLKSRHDIGDSRLMRVQTVCV